MAQILEIMSSDITVPGTADFVVNNAVSEVPVTAPPAIGLEFENSNGDSWFELGDNIIITGVWINIPYGLGQGTGKVSLGIVWHDILNFGVIIPELAGNSVLTLPNLCGPLDMPPSGLFVLTPNSGPKRRLVLTVLALNVSQLNVPALINGATLKVQVHIRLIHTKPLTALP